MIGVRRFLTAWEDRQSLLAGVNSLRCEIVQKDALIAELRAELRLVGAESHRWRNEAERLRERLAAS